MIPILLLEDDPRLGPATRDLLSLDWDVIWVTTIAEAKDALAKKAFGAMVVDRRVPDGDGADLVHWLRERGDWTPALLLTALGETRDKVAGLDAGANDYLVKPVDFEELGARLRVLTRDFAGDCLEIGSWAFYPSDSSIESPYTGRILLTSKENALLNLLARHPDQAFSREQLLAAVFDHGEQLGTVDTYVHYVRKKTDRDLIQTVRGSGYRLGTPA